MGEDEIKKLLKEDVSFLDKCDFCAEGELDLGTETKYGSIIIYKIGEKKDEMCFATISPRTGGSPDEDFTIQLMTCQHLTHFSQLEKNPVLSANLGIAFAKLSRAISEIMCETPRMKAASDKRDDGIAIGLWGKCTTWKEKKEHLHLKLFQFRNNLGQPTSVDSSFGRKEIYRDKEGNEFVKMVPVRKKQIPKIRFRHLADRLITLLK